MHLNHARRRFTLRQRMYLFAFIACLFISGDIRFPMR